MRWASGWGEIVDQHVDMSAWGSVPRDLRSGDRAKPTEPPRAGTLPHLDAPTMLIVEDAPLIAFDLTETMRELGFDVHAVAASHAEARRAIEQGVPEFAIVDLHLGGRQESIRASEDLLALLDGLGCRCLIFSGDEAACRRMALRFPHFAVVTKPADQTRLASELERLRLSARSV